MKRSLYSKRGAKKLDTLTHPPNLSNFFMSSKKTLSVKMKKAEMGRFFQ